MKIQMYSPIKEEAGVVMAFSKLHEELGFPKLVPSSARGFDIDDIEYKGKRVTVEFEYLSENFISHGHVEQMKDGRNYVLVCYEDNCSILQKLREIYNKTNLEVIELKNFIEIKQDIVSDNEDSIEYIVLNYNPYMAGLPIDSWKSANVYGINAQFSNNHITAGSKILFKQGDFIVARCEVVKYETYETPQNDNEWRLLQNLYNYPLGLYNLTLEEVKENMAHGYIFYDSFTTFDERKVSFSKALPNRNMGHQGMIKITREDYYKLMGY